MKIVGPSVCPSCALSGHDSDSCRANLLDNGHVACFTCGSITEPVPEDVRRSVRQMPPGIAIVVGNLFRSRDKDAPGLKLIYERNGLGHISHDRAVAAVAHGCVEALLEADALVTLVFASVDRTARLELRYDKTQAPKLSPEAISRLFNGGFYISEPKAGTPAFLAQELEQVLRSRACPPDLAAACARLMLNQFTVQHTNLDDRMRRVLLRFTDPATSVEITAECTYCL